MLENSRKKNQLHGVEALNWCYEEGGNRGGTPVPYAPEHHVDQCLCGGCNQDPYHRPPTRRRQAIPCDFRHLFHPTLTGVRPPIFKRPTAILKGHKTILK
jgi:hypothetical protein